MELLGFLGYLIVVTLVWRWVAKKMHSRGNGVFFRHLTGSSAGIFVGTLAVGIIFFEKNIVEVKKTEISSVATPTTSLVPVSDVVLTKENLPIPVVDMRIRKSIAPPTYSIVKDETLAHYKRTVEVELSSRVNEDDLVRIAKEIFAKEKRKTERTFIGYRIGGKAKGYWATSDYDPNLKIRILGFTADGFEAVKTFDVSKAYPQAIGVWPLEEGFGYLMVAYKRDGKHYIDSFTSDQDKVTNEYVAKRMKDGGLRLTELDNDVNEYYVIDKKGDLQAWGYSGMYMSVQPLN